MPIGELASASVTEAFLTSTIRGVQPLEQVGERRFAATRSDLREGGTPVRRAARGDRSVITDRLRFGEVE